MDDYCFIPLQVLHQASLWTSSGPLILVLVLLVISALISSSEVAMFSLSPGDLNDLRSSKSAPDQAIMELLEKPDKQEAPTKLLATILIANNAVNIAIVLLASELSGQWFPDGVYTEWVKTLIDVVAITFVIVLFGEVIPKVYATSNPVKVARLMAFPLKYIQKLCSPLTSGLMFLSSNLESLIKTSGKGNISVDELGHALELTVDDHLSDEENKILEGIVTFGTKEARQIMTPRTDIAFLWIEDPFEDVMKTVMDKGYSRLPVYRTSPDEIEGFLFIKDLLPYIDHTSFDWQTLIKKPFFVPENKMIDDLLQEFQHAKIHLAIVVDEYGGTSGLVTLEDILEEMEMLSSLPSQINMLEDASLFLAEQKKQSTMQRKSSEKKDVEKNNSSNQTTTQSNTKSIDIASLNESEKNIYSTLLEADSISMDRLVELTSMPIHKINSTLMTLELKKIIKRQGPSICRA